MHQTIEQVKARKYFYRDYYRKASTALIGILLLIALLSSVIIYLYMQRTIPAYYATSSDGKLVPLSPLEAPNYSSSPLIP